MSRVHIVSQMLHAEIAAHRELRNEVNILKNEIQTLSINQNINREKIFKIKDIKSEDLGFSLEPCKNCSTIGCWLEIDFYIDGSPSEYRISYTRSGRRRQALYTLLDSNRVPSREIKFITIPSFGKPIVSRAHFECSKPYNEPGSIPTSIPAGSCSFGPRHDVRELIKKKFGAVFDRLCS